MHKSETSKIQPLITVLLVAVESGFGPQLTRRQDSAISSLSVPGRSRDKASSRFGLRRRNLAILKSATYDMKPFREDTVILLVANPVDVLTYFCQKYSGLPKGQIIGSGTFLDSARLRGILAAKLGVDAGSVDAYVLGEHGESQMVAWSCVTVGAVPLDQCLLPGASIDRKAVALETKDKAAKIIEAKGATAYGIGALSAAICKSILFDQRNVRPISHWVAEYGCCLSLPVVLGRRGIIRSLSIPLNQEERGLLHKSADTLKKFIQEAEQAQK
ncbi:L-lactate dehydrogenase [Fonsecaea erecta]|uniref:L-lactate dehydrogenase n=1 Tax=Fonsecaea erecta TaxID=1367422 RepID=A0A178Z423_9EURO|nr:L-lactate dehydrogenase [Fonsecaea erecta]OAP54482.1 L-lactate dehydrogenase [Fonsecaea erecta]